MTKVEHQRGLISVRIVMGFLVAFALLYGAQFIALISTLRVYLTWTHHPETENQFVSGLTWVICWMLAAALYVFILVQLFLLLLRVGKRDPFNPANPRRIRWVAYGAFAIGALTLIHEAISYLVLFPNTGDPSSSIFIRVISLLVRSAQMVVFGLGILIIGKILETGVRLQQSENLTI